MLSHFIATFVELFKATFVESFMATFVEPFMAKFVEPCVATFVCYGIYLFTTGYSLNAVNVRAPTITAKLHLVMTAADLPGKEIKKGNLYYSDSK